MKRKFSLGWRVAVVLALVASLGMVFAAPTGAVLPAGLSVDVRAFCKCDDGHLWPVGSGACRCVDEGDRFYVNAAVTAIDVDVDDVEATITIVSGDAILDPAESATKELGNIQSCRLGDAWWKLLCTGPENVEVQVDVEGDGGTVTASGTKTIKQCVEECAPCVVMDFIEPKDCSYEVEVCQTFGVKVEIDTDCDIEGVSATISITDTYASDPSENPSDAAMLVEGMPETFYLSDMEADSGTEVGWTLHCERPEDVLVWVAVDYDGAECEEPIVLEVQQKAPACLYVTWDEPTVDPVQICAGCDVTFLLDPLICNPCDYDLEYVIANLTWTNPTSVDVPFPYTRSIDLIEANSCWEPEPWEVECLEPGTVVFTLEVRGYDAKTGDEKVVISTRTVEQVDFLVNITTPTDSDTFSTEQEFCVRIDLMNCTGDDLTDIPVTLSVDPDTGATLVTEDNGVCNGECPDDWTQLVDLCDCCFCEDVQWCLECAEPNEDMDIIVTVDLGGGETYTDTVTVHQELKAHLVAGLQSYYQCDPDHLLTPITAFAPDQVFHVIVPVYNTGEATVYDAYVILDFDGPVEFVMGSDYTDDIQRPIYGGEMRKARWMMRCTGEGDVTIEVEEVGGIDTNTKAPVLEDNICLPCPLDIKQIPVELTWIEWPEECIEPCTDFTLKVVVQNWDFDDDLSGVSATLYWTGDVDSVEFAEGQPQTVDLDDLLSQEKWKGVATWITGKSCDTADSGTSTTLVDSDAGWSSDQLIGLAVEITAGTGSGQVRKIIDNMGTSLTVDPDWSTTPTDTSEYCIIEGEWAEATWQMHCKDIGDVEFYFVVSVEDPLMCITSDTKYVCQEVPSTCLEIDIISPDMGSFYATGQEFAVTAEIKNRGIQCVDCPVPFYASFEAWNVVAGLTDFGYDIAMGPHFFEDGLGHFTIVDCNFPEAADDCDGMTLWDIGNIPAGESAMVTWTVRCDRSGLTAVVAEVDWDNMDVECVHPGLPLQGYEWFLTALQYKFDVHDFLLLWQYPTSHLEVEILTVMPDTTVNVCDEFIVTYKVKNTGEADASQVEAILSVTPEGTVRPAEGYDSGYTQYIGTIPGYGETEPLTWPLHCKEACESTINITAEGLDEYGWHKKQQCANTGNFFIEGGCMVVEGLESYPTDTDMGWTYGVFVGDANGLTGPFSIDTTMSWAMAGGGPDISAQIVMQGYVLPHVGTFGGWAIEDLCGDCCNLLDLLGDVEGEDLMIFVGHWTTDAYLGEFREEQCVVGGLLEVINGKITGADVQYCADGDCIGGGGLKVVSFLGGEYCSSMAAEAGLPIDPRFIEDAWVTIKQLPSAGVDLGIIKTVDNPNPEVAEDITYTITVANYGPGQATGVVVTDTIEDTVVNVESAVATQGTYDDSTGEWTVGNMTVGASASLMVTAEVQLLDEYTNEATVTCDQPDGNTLNDTDSATINPSLAIQLEENWNFVSWPLIPDNANIEPEGTGVLKDLAVPDLTTNLEVVWGEYDPEAGTWDSYDPESMTNTLTEMWDGIGFWIDMKTPGLAIVIEGQELPTPPAMPRMYPVVGGAGGYWNVIGFKSTTAKSPDDYLEGIAGQYTIIYGFDEGAYFVVGTPGHLNLEPGLAYWIAVLESGKIFP